MIVSLALTFQAMMPLGDTPTSKGSGTLKIKFQGIKTTSGDIYLSIYKSDKGFPSDSRQALRREKVSATAASKGLTLDALPFGTYAISFFYDANGNGKLDKDFLGIPKEAYGFSNNAHGSFGPPSFSKAKFHFSTDGQTTTLVALGKK